MCCNLFLWQGDHLKELGPEDWTLFMMYPLAQLPESCGRPILMGDKYDSTVQRSIKAFKGFRFTRTHMVVCF